jgi:hypothetical protein
LTVTSDYLGRLRRVAVVRRLSHDVVVEDRAPDGQRRRHTTDQLGNTVTEWARSDRQDLTLRPPGVRLVIATAPDVRRELRRQSLLSRGNLARVLAGGVWRAARNDIVDIRTIANRRHRP